jgi:hypothetical protein
MNGSEFRERNALLVREFDRYILEHQDFADRIPDDALVVMQMEGDDAFNSWARQIADKVVEPGGTVVYITVTDLKPVRSRIAGLRLEVAA